MVSLLKQNVRWNDAITDADSIYKGGIDNIPVVQNQKYTQENTQISDDGNLKLVFSYQQKMFKLSLPQIPGECASTSNKQSNLEACFAEGNRVRVTFSDGEYKTSTSHPASQFLNGPVDLETVVEE